jgi:hypothetical protein
MVGWRECCSGPDDDNANWFGGNEKDVSKIVINKRIHGLTRGWMDIILI